MSFRARPDSFYSSERVNYDAIADRMFALRGQCANAPDIPAFMAVIGPVFQDVILDYGHLLYERLYRQNEFVTILSHLEDCVNALMPAHLPYKAMVLNGQLICVHKSVLPPQEKDS